MTYILKNYLYFLVAITNLHNVYANLIHTAVVNVM
jgi:hypothetical protein